MILYTLMLIVGDALRQVPPNGDGNPATLNDNGQYLMYGWRPWSSYTTFLIDGQPMIFPFGDVIEAPHDVDKETNIATYRYKDLVITQTIKLIRGSSTGQMDNFKVSYSVTNTYPDKSTIDNHTYYVGARIMLDTMVGYNDGAPFRVPGLGAITTETSMWGTYVPNYWQAYDRLESPTLVSQGTLVSMTGPKPTSIVFANWSKLYSNSWAYDVDKSNINDSAVAMYWEPKNILSPNGYKLEPGESETFETYYGLGSYSQSKGNISLIASGDNNLQLNSFGQYFPDPFMANALITNQDSVPQDVTVSINLPDGITNDITTPTSKTFTLEAGETQSIAWQLHATPESEDRTLQYVIKVSIGGVEVNSTTRSVFLPKHDKKLVIFIPGLLGSELWTTDKSEQLWIPQGLDKLSDLNTLSDMSYEVYAKQPLPMFFGIDQGWGLDLLKQQGFNVETFAYDWRQSNWEVTAKKLDDFIKKEKAIYGVSKVDLVVHSMGGIVTKSYLEQFDKSVINKVIFVGTPHLGAPESLYMFRTGDIKDAWPFNSFVRYYIKKIAKNAPSGYQLLPSKRFFEAYKPEGLNYYYDEETDTNGDGIESGKIDDWNSMFNWLDNTSKSTNYNNQFKDIFSNSLLSKMNIHDYIDDPTIMDGINYYVIAGQNMGTVGSMRDYITWHWNSEALDYLPELTSDVNFINGDMTVPLLSGTWNGAAGNHSYYATVKHSNMFKNRGIIEQITNILNDKPNELGTGITTQQSQLNGYAVTINSPVTLGIRTQNGYVGPDDNNAELIQEDDGVTYRMIDHNKFAFVPGNDPFNIILKGEDTGTFSLTIKRIENGKIVKAAKFMEVPVSQGDFINIKETETLDSKLDIDRYGDGSIDNVVAPKVLAQHEAEDTIRPVLSEAVEGVKGNNNWYRSDVTATLSATDEGSGIESVIYNLDKGNGKYLSPIKLIEEGKHTVWAVAKDKNDNYSTPINTDIYVDKTAPNVSSSVDKFYPLGGSLTVNYEASDNVSGIDNIRVELNGLEVNKGQRVSLTRLGTNELTITATDIAGNTTVLTKNFEVYLPVNISIEPKTINLNGNGVVTAFMFLPFEYPSCPLGETVNLEGIYAERDVYTQNKLIYKFNRDQLLSRIPKGESIPLTVTGYTGLYYVRGTTTVTVK